MLTVLVFDVNETLLDLGALDAEFERVFGSADVRQLWFAQVLQNAMISVITDSYQPFGVIAVGALEQVAERCKVPTTHEQAVKIVSGMRTLPPHPEVPGALEKLRDAGFRLCALTNSVQEIADAQLAHTHLAPLFERIFSADSVKRLKPSRAPYEYAAREMGVPLAETCLIAAHAWDVTGAQRAGAQGAFVARPGMTLDPLAPHPTIVGSDLNDIAAQLIDETQRRTR